MKQQINKVSKLQHCASRLYRIHIFSHCTIVFIHAQLYTDLACLPVKCEAYCAALSHCHSVYFIQYILMPRSCPNYIDFCWMFAYIAVPYHTLSPCINTTSGHLFHALAQLIYTNLVSLLGLHSAYHIKAVNGTERQTYFYYNQIKNKGTKQPTTPTYQVLNGYK